MMEITKAKKNMLEGRRPEKANEVVVSEYFLSTYGNNAKIGDTVTLDTESFHGDYVVTGITDSVNEKEANTCAIILSKAALTEWNVFDPAGYRAYVHFKNSDQLGEELITSYCREIAEEYQLPMPKMNSKYFAYASKSFDFALMAGVIAVVLIGGYIVIQSIFRISINDKIRSYGQLRTIGATPKQIKRIVKNEGRKLGSIGILIGTVLGVCGGFLLFSKGFNAVSYGDGLDTDVPVNRDLTGCHQTFLLPYFRHEKDHETTGLRPAYINGPLAHFPGTFSGRKFHKRPEWWG